MSMFDTILSPIMWVVAWIMVLAHRVIATVLSGDSGAAWVLSIVVLTIIIRIVLIPLFIKQINSARSMQLMQPEMQKLQRKYKGKKDPMSRQRQQQEMQALMRKHGANPMTSCLSPLLQSPVFFALFRVLSNLQNIATGKLDPIGPLNAELAKSAEQSTVFGAPLSSTFMKADQVAGSDVFTIRAVAIVLILAMSITMFTTTKQLTMKNMPASSMDNNPMMMTQKIMLYGMPLIFLFSGVNFPLGVLVYWVTTNLWTFGQQYIMIRNRPAPGSEAERKLKERRRAKAQKRADRKGVTLEEELGIEASEASKQQGQRVQPKKQSRSKRQSTRPAIDTRPGIGKASSTKSEGAAEGDAEDAGSVDGKQEEKDPSSQPTPKKPSGQRQQPQRKKKRR